MAKKKPTKMLAVLGRCYRVGIWRIASRSSVLALLGICHLDMRQSTTEGETLKMKVTVLFGSATLILPPGAVVKPSGMAILARSSVDVPEDEEESSLPTLEIEWTAILGRIRIVTTLDEELGDDEQLAAAQMPPAATPATAQPAPPMALPAPAQPLAAPVAAVAQPAAVGIGFADPQHAPAGSPSALIGEVAPDPTAAPVGVEPSMMIGGPAEMAPVTATAEPVPAIAAEEPAEAPGLLDESAPEPVSGLPAEATEAQEEAPVSADPADIGEQPSAPADETVEATGSLDEDDDAPDLAQDDVDATDPPVAEAIEPGLLGQSGGEAVGEPEEATESSEAQAEPAAAEEGLVEVDEATEPTEAAQQEPVEPGLGGEQPADDEPTEIDQQTEPTVAAEQLGAADATGADEPGLLDGSPTESLSANTEPGLLDSDQANGPGLFDEAAEPGLLDEIAADPADAVMSGTVAGQLDGEATDEVTASTEVTPAEMTTAADAGEDGPGLLDEPAPISDANTDEDPAKTAAEELEPTSDESLAVGQGDDDEPGLLDEPGPVAEEEPEPEVESVSEAEQGQVAANAKPVTVENDEPASFEDSGIELFVGPDAEVISVEPVAPEAEKASASAEPDTPAPAAAEPTELEPNVELLDDEPLDNGPGPIEYDGPVLLEDDQPGLLDGIADAPQADAPIELSPHGLPIAAEDDGPGLLDDFAVGATEPIDGSASDETQSAFARRREDHEPASTDEFTDVPAAADPYADHSTDPYADDSGPADDPASDTAQAPDTATGIAPVSGTEDTDSSDEVVLG